MRSCDFLFTGMASIDLQNQRDMIAKTWTVIFSLYVFFQGLVMPLATFPGFEEQGL